MDNSRLRKIGSAAVIYLGVAWGILEAFSFLMQKYGLEEGYQDILIKILLVGFPLVLVYNALENPLNRIGIGIYATLLVVGGYFIAEDVRSFNNQLMGLRSASENVRFSRVAVMPVLNLTGQDTIDYLIHGIHESLTNELGQLKLFDVISNRTTNQFAGLQASLMDFNHQLDVDAIIETSVLGSGDSVRIEVRMTGTEPERQLWSGNFNYATTNILDLYAHVSKSIARQIDKEFNNTPEPVSRSYNEAAIRAYYKGMQHWDNLTIDELNLSLKYFEQSVKLDETFPGGYVGVAIAWGGLAQMMHVPYEEVEKKGIPQLKKALQLDSTNVAVLMTKGMFYGWWLWDWEKGEEGYMRALEINPSYSDDMSVYSHFLIALGRSKEALEQIKRALEIDPLNTRFIAYYAMILNFDRQYEAAEKVLIDSLGNLVETGLTYSTLQTTYHLSKQYNKAIDMWITMYNQRNDKEAADLIENTYKKEGYEATLVALADLFIARSESEEYGYVSTWAIATKLLRGGDYEHALDWLEKAYEEHNVNMPYINIDPIFDPIRDHPRFVAIHQKMNFPK